jgi:hypothetical protein
MIQPYTAVGLIPTVRGIRKRADIKINLEHLSHLVKAASWLSSLDLPVRLIALPEGALQAFNDEVLDLDHSQFARECAIDIPGEETEELGKLARQYDAFIMAQAKARHPDWQDRFFNVGFILNPQGEVSLISGVHLMAWRISHPSASPNQRLPTLAVRQTALLGGSAPPVDRLPRSDQYPAPGHDRLLVPWPGDGPRCPAHRV